MTTKVAIVTGGNKGVGFGTVKGLAEKFDGDVFLTARDPLKGKEAVKKLEDSGIKAKFHQLNIDDTESIDIFKQFLYANYCGIDVLINNAGINFKSPDDFGLQAETTVRTNYWSTKNVCDALFPILRPGARVVNVSSMNGSLTRIPEGELRKKLGSKDLERTELDALMTEFVTCAKSGTLKEKGWPESTYSVSKVGLSALSRIQQREFDSCPEKDLVVNHVHPGYVATDMTRHQGPLSVEEGAKSSIYAALLPPKTDTRGHFIWEDCKSVPWGDEPK